MFKCGYIDSFPQDDSTRQSQDSNYSDDGGVSALGRGSEQQELLTNDDSNLSFPPMSDNARQSVQDSDADPDMRLGQLPAFCHVVVTDCHCSVGSLIVSPLTPIVAILVQL